MTHSWKILGLPLLLAAVLPAAAYAADEPPRPSDTQSLEQTLRDIRKSLAALESVPQDVKTLREKTDALETRLDGLHQRIDLNTTATRDKIAELNDRIRRLEGDLEALRNQKPSGANQTSGFSPVGPGPAAPPGSGRIRLHNTFARRVSIVVNDTAYDLDPGETYVIERQPAGPFTYEVLGIQPRKNSFLGANDTADITVFNR